jgi:hypothetical protein
VLAWFCVGCFHIACDRWSSVMDTGSTSRSPKRSQRENAERQVLKERNGLFGRRHARPRLQGQTAVPHYRMPSNSGTLNTVASRKPGLGHRGYIGLHHRGSSTCHLHEIKVERSATCHQACAQACSATECLKLPSGTAIITPSLSSKKSWIGHVVMS